MSSIVPRVCMFANKDICKGEELTFSYGDSANVGQAGIKGKESNENGEEGEEGEEGEKREEGEEGELTKVRRRCLCGSKNCKTELPYDQY